jgi:aspartyl-tRNA(Asn)/glutamyl-tRNA(Gln) amidotransferase subunit A
VPDFRADLGRGVKGLRIGLVRHWYEADRRASDDTIAAMDAAIAVLRDLGAVVEEITLAPLAAYQACMRTIGISESFAIHADWLRARPGDYGEVFRYRITPGALVPAPDYVQALRLQRVLAQGILDALRDHDALITAGSWGEAPVMAEMRAEANFAAPPLTNPFNVSQTPALSLCNGFGKAGLPLSMQVTAKPFEEAMVFRIGHAYEQATPWRARRPTVPATQVRDTPISQAAPAPSEAARTAYGAMAERAALGLDPGRFAQLCEAMPHLEAMATNLPRTLPFGAEPSTSFVFPGE